MIAGMRLVDFVIMGLAAVGAHRLWNFEDIFAPVRTLIPQRWWTKPVLCRACNAFWIAFAVTWARAAHNDAVDALLVALSLFAIVRATLWVMVNVDLRAAPAPISAPAPAPSVPVAPTSTPSGTVWAPTPATPPPQEAPPKPGCTACSQKRQSAEKIHDRAMAYDRRVVLLTALSSFPASYSVSTVVLDQARMLATDPKCLVQVWVMEGTDLRTLPFARSNIEFRAIIPTVAWKEDSVIPDDVGRLAATLRENLMPLGNATIISHDLLFISHFLSFAAAIHQMGQLKAFAWLHVCHSAAGKERPRGDALKYRATVPNGHRLLCLNPNDREHLAAYYDVPLDRVSVATNARDVTTFGRVDPYAVHLIGKHRLDEADVVQIFPVSGTRLGAKGMPTLLKILGRVAKLGMSVKLVVVNAHSNSVAVQHALQAYRREADASGLGSANMIVTSEEFESSAADGLPATAVRDLFAISNLFVMPSISEASSLVLLEAAMSGCLIVSNSSLHTLDGFVNPEWSLQAPFGSVRSPGDTSDHDEVAMEIVQLLRGSMLNRCKRDILRRFNYRVVAEQLAAAVEATPPL